MKQLFMFKCDAVLSGEDVERMRQRIKGQIEDGVLLLDGRLNYYGAVQLPEARGRIIHAIAEEAAPGGVTLTRRRRDVSGFATIKATIASGRGPEYIRPFDELSFMLDTGEAVTAVCGGYITPTRARFVLKDCLKTQYKMNETATNEGGYFASKGRKAVLEEIYPHFPEELQEIIEPRALVETIGGKRFEYADPLWIPSGTDVFGSLDGDWFAEEPDSVQLEIFKNERDRVKAIDGDTASWWLRSPRVSYSTSFVYVGTGGAVYATNAGSSIGFAPGFDL